ncbi:MAG: tRNA (adenosine(37)-N6)-threonylcarbamoyltransferase complex transferase subunit TsaD [Candidatus Kerfeldbacteria bacterium]
MNILAIETSCDETSAAVIMQRHGIAQITSNVVASQIAIHARTGGVVPEVAAREHVGPIIPSVTQALRRARCTLKDMTEIAVTAGPGLHTALAVGVETAKALSYALGKPLIPVNHIHGHIAANWNGRRPILPALSLVVSGGHTELILISRNMTLRRLGSTRDDAAGECFDKTAQLLRLGYPGGPAIERMAAQGNPSAYDLPHPMLTEKNLEFSFAGLKTSVRYLVEKDRTILRSRRKVADLCASIQKAIVDVLVEKTMRAARQYRPKEILLAGGVAANKELRQRLSRAARHLPWHPTYHQPPLPLCMDNAGMIGLAAAHFPGTSKRSAWKTTDIAPGLSV